VELGVKYPQLTEQSTSRRFKVCGGTKEVKAMKLASWIIFGVLVWFALPVIVPLGILYVIFRMLNAFAIGEAVEEAHNDN
jgi:uncharacterized membrane protein